MSYAEKINGMWIEKTPRQFRNARNASIPDARLADEGLHEVTVDPKPDASGQVVEPGPIVDRDGLPVRTWITRDPTPEEVTQKLAKLRATAQLDRFEFARRAAAAGYITYVEAAQWAAGNLIPSAVQAIIDGLPAEQQGPVTLDVLAIPVIRRMGSLMPALAAAFQTDDAGLDALFGLT
jgi:hypothetical protein